VATEFLSGGSIDNTSYAFFAQGTYDITDRLALTVGGRYSDDELRFRPEQVFTAQLGAAGQALGNFFGPQTIAVGQAILPRVWVESNEDNFSPAATLSFDVNDEIMTYVTYSQGYKAGGFTMRALPAQIPGVNITATDPNVIIPAFGPEKVKNYEIGLKSQLFDDRMRLNLAGFYTNYDSLQLLSTAGVNITVPVVVNAGDADLWGIEVESELLVTDWLRMNASLGWLDHEYKTIEPGTSGVTLTNRLANAPKWNANIGFTADVMQNEMGHAYLRFDWSHKGTQFKDATNVSFLKQDSYDIVNMSLSWESVDQHWLATAGVSNLTDEIYIVSGVTNGGTGINVASPSRPRELFVKLKYSY
jgi:iron complex outermembrane receptor protein